MKKIMKRTIGVLFALILTFSFVACGYQPYQKVEDDFLTFKSSDDGLDNFTNDYFKRHLRYDENRIGTLSLGNSVLFNKEWEALSLMWFDSTGNTVPDDRYDMVKMWLEELPVDKFGYVWSALESVVPATDGPLTYFSQGWPFPDYAQSQANSVGYEFNGRDSERWSASEGADESVANGLYSISYKGSDPLEIYSDFRRTQGIDTFHAPFLEIDLRMTDKKSFGNTSDVEDIYVYFKTTDESEWSEDKKVSLKDFSTLPVEEIPAVFNKHIFFPMYLHPKWKDHRVTDIKIVICPKSGQSMDIQANLNFVRLNYDTRHVNNIALLITASKTYYEFTGDKTFLEENISRLRSAMMFYLETLGGRSGLIDQSCMVGHDGLVGVGHGMGNGYWDILALPAKDLYANTFFYKALRDLSWLEEMVECEGIQIEKPSVVNAGTGQLVQYSETSESLSALSEIVKQNMQTGFWSEDKGRFISGVNANGDIIDYGFIMFNLEAVQCGIANDEQAQQIMDWISGKRIIEGEDSVGEDIYIFEFAPRATTIENKSQYVNGGGQIALFGGQVQDGGTSMYMSYYDLMSRIRVYGQDNAFDRLKEIQDWYEKVAAAGGTGNRFYRDYYDMTDFTLQGGGTQGGLGLDEEFLESALMTSAIPFGFFGIGNGDYKTLSVAPNMPSDLNFWEMENLMFQGVKYDLAITKRSIEVNAVRGDTQGLKLTLKLAEPAKKNYSVYVNGQKSDNYSVENGRIVISVDFARTKIEIK